MKTTLRSRKIIHIAAAIAALILLVSPGFSGGVRAQTGSSIWEQATNLSQSGAASQPRVVSTPDGKIQAFWWDSFDGLVTSIFLPSSDGSAGAWSSPVAVQIPGAVVTSSPTILVDSEGWLHALFIGQLTVAQSQPIDRQPDPSGQQNLPMTPLLHSQMRVGSTDWSMVDIVADSALAFDVSASPNGGLAVAYIRPVQNDQSPSGIFTRFHPGGLNGWQQASLVNSSIYYRVLSTNEAWVRIWNGGNGGLYLTWNDPQLDQVQFSASPDYGRTWEAPETIQMEDNQAVMPRVAALPDGSVLRLWQTTSSECSLYQQSSPPITAEQPARQWSPANPVLSNRSICPQSDRILPLEDYLLWLWGEGSNTLTYTVWHQALADWSIPIDLRIGFEDPASKRPVSLDDLHVTLANNNLVAVGVDQTRNEIWVTRTDATALELAYAPLSPWKAPDSIQQSGIEAGLVQAMMDASGALHLAWAEHPLGNPAGWAVMYARWNGALLARPAAVYTAKEGEIARQPAFLEDPRGRIHMVWSGGEQGQLFYSSASSREAGAAANWSAPVEIVTDQLVSWPQIGQDASGTIYVLYSVSYNAGRGVYLVRSGDGGRTWSAPETVFNAEAAGWEAVDHPNLAVLPDGRLFAAWVDSPLPDTWPPRGIFYSSSTDQGASWSEPYTLAGPGFDWPRLVFAGGQLHFLSSESDGAGVWHRWTPLEGASGETGWSVAAPVPGMQRASSPAGLSVDGVPPLGTLHLAGADPELNELLYTTWNGKSWTAVETFSLPLESKVRSGAVAATRPQGGQLAVVYIDLLGADSQGATSVEVTTRSIPDVDLARMPTLPPPAPTPSPDSTAEPTLAPTLQPSPTPALNQIPLPSGPAVPPLAIGGGLTAVVVAFALVTRRMWRH